MSFGLRGRLFLGLRLFPVPRANPAYSTPESAQKRAHGQCVRRQSGRGMAVDHFPCGTYRAFETLSLRQSFCDQHSPLGFGRA